MVKNCKVLVLCSLFMVALVGCKDKEQPVNPYITPGNVEDPHWVLTVENDMSASMTAIVKVSFSQAEGSLAAFMDTTCCGIAEYKSEYGQYWLYISPATSAGGNVQLRFYSPSLKRIFDAQETITFRNDTQLGTVSAPYTPTWVESPSKK